MLERVILAGYRNTWLVPAGARDRLLAAEALTAEHGLGASTVATRRRWFAPRSPRCASASPRWDIALPPVDHPELGRA